MAARRSRESTPPRDLAGTGAAPRARPPLKESERRFRSQVIAALAKQQVERRKLARMLHDEVAQVLSGAGLQLDILRMDFEERAPGIGPKTAEIQELLERAVGQIRGLSYALS